MWTALESGYGMTGGKVTRIFCALCTKHQDRLRAVRNFISAFVDGITETALKKDNVCKHQRSDMHGKAVNMERQPTINEIYSSTPLWRAFASESLEEINRVSKLFDIAFMLVFNRELMRKEHPLIVQL